MGKQQISLTYNISIDEKGDEDQVLRAQRLLAIALGKHDIVEAIVSSAIIQDLKRIQLPETEYAISEALLGMLSEEDKAFFADDPTHIYYMLTGAVRVNFDHLQTQEDPIVPVVQALLETKIQEVEEDQRVYISSGSYGNSRYHLLDKRYDGVQIEQVDTGEKWSKRINFSTDEIPVVLKTLLVWYLKGEKEKALIAALEGEDLERLF